MFRSAAPAPARPNPWTSTVCGGANPFYYSKLATARDAVADAPDDTTALARYVDLLHVFVDEMGKTRSRAPGNTGFASTWSDGSGGKACLRSVRGELVVANVALCRLLVASERPRLWERAARLQMWVGLAQIAVWPARPAAVEMCTERAAREIVATALVRLQMKTFALWEERGAKGTTGAALLRWALVQTQRLAARKPALAALVDEQKALLCLYAREKVTARRTVLLHTASVLFERLGMTERQEQVRALAPLLEVRHVTTGYAEILRECLPRAACPMAENMHFARDYVPDDAAEYRRLFHLA